MQPFRNSSISMTPMHKVSQRESKARRIGRPQKGVDRQHFFRMSLDLLFHNLEIIRQLHILFFEMVFEFLDAEPCIIIRKSSKNIFLDSRCVNFYNMSQFGLVPSRQIITAVSSSLLFLSFTNAFIILP